MCDAKPEKSDSDVSTNSWTLLDDENDKVQAQEPEIIDLTTSETVLSTVPNTPEAAEVPEAVEVPGASEVAEVPEKPVETRENGFLSLDEFLQERMIEHDYDYEDKLLFKISKKHKRKKGSRKYKAPFWGISVFLGIMLTLTAVTTLCSQLSQDQSLKPVDGDLKMVKQVRRDHKIIKAELLQEIDKNIKAIERFHSRKLSTNCKNDTLAHCNRMIGVKLVDKPLNNSLIMPPDAKLDVKPETKTVRLEPSKEPNVLKPKMKIPRTKWAILKEVLLDTNVHALVSLIMTNVYLFTLLTDLSRRYKHERHRDEITLEDLTKIDNPEELRKYLFKELPFYGVELIRKSKYRKVKAKRKPTNSNLTLARIDSIPSGDSSGYHSYFNSSCLVLKQEPKPLPLPLPCGSLELGKSECERRFQELDECQRKFDNLKQLQRDRIKLLKQKYRNEVSYIRDTEEESEARAEKINRTSKRFIKKLKFNREKYLSELRKVRELRRKVEKRDACTGSYAVAIPSVYNFGGIH